MIDPDKFYRPTELLNLAKEGLFPIKSRTTLIRLHKAGKLIPANVGTESKPMFVYYGKDIEKFLKECHEQPKIYQNP